MDHRVFRCVPCKRQGNVMTWPINPVFGRYCTWCKGPVVEVDTSDNEPVTVLSLNATVKHTFTRAGLGHGQEAGK